MLKTDSLYNVFQFNPQIDLKSLKIETAWRGPPQCQQCGIRHLVLFADLEHDDFALIHRPIDELLFSPAQSLYQPGDPPDYVYTVREGLIKLSQSLPTGDQRIVRLLRKGDVAGLEALLSQSYQHTATVLEPVETCRIPVTVVDQLSKETPRMHQQLMARWQHALSEADSWLTELSTGPARARLSRLLLRLTQCCPEDLIHLPSREDIGAMLGITTETASRLVAEFKREGFLIKAAQKRLRIDIAGLEQILKD